MRIQKALHLPTKKEADQLVTVFICCLEDTLFHHLGEEGFSMKLGSFGKFSVHHRPAIWRDDPHKAEAQDSVRQLGAAAPARNR